MQRQRKRRFFGALAALLVIAFIFVPCAAETPVYRSVQTNTKRIALTFDDGPHPYLTPKILEILKKNGVAATFFMVGENVVNYPEAARAVLREGHEIGNHTFSHRHLSTLDEAGVRHELELCEEALRTLCEYRPHLFRPPEGAVTRSVEDCTEHEDYSLVLWSLDTRDWESKSVDRIVNTVINNIQPGDIILMHDYIGVKSKTPEALEILLPELLRRGYEPVTVSQLLGLG
ncbi:MAG: hypothetical protein E7643_08835 [Ruminococcaceae bacterium]|nr:hypothetical protein [Oscillospiraceae bacterium]